MLVKRARKVCTCVTLAIFTKLTIFIMGNPIICLLRNFTGYLGYTQASISLSHLENCAPPPVTTRGPEFRPPSGFCRYIWALARAPDLHLNIHQLVTSSNNSTQKFHTFPTNFQPGHLNKDTWNVTVPDSLSLSLSTRQPKNGKT